MIFSTTLRRSASSIAAQRAPILQSELLPCCAAGMSQRTCISSARLLPESRVLWNLADELDVAQHVTMHGRATKSSLHHFLLGVDGALQLRTSKLLSLSGALADCIAFGVPTVASADLASEMDAPSYVVPVASASRALPIAEAVAGLRHLRRDACEPERQAYLARRSADGYARALLEGLGLWADRSFVELPLLIGDVAQLLSTR